MRPSFETSKEQGPCYICGDTVVIPPGMWYRGMRMHKHCYTQRKSVDYSDEVLAPILDNTENRLRALLANMRPMSEG